MEWKHNSVLNHDYSAANAITETAGMTHQCFPTLHLQHNTPLKHTPQVGQIGICFTGIGSVSLFRYPTLILEMTQAFKSVSGT